MFPFERAQWIFADTEVCEDLYTDYRDVFSYTGGKVWFFISADSDYTLFINNKYVASNQYSDFPHYKIYDEIELSPFLTEGENTLSLLVYYCGRDTQRYRRGVAGVIFEAFSGYETILSSGEHTLSRRNPAYESGACVFVSPQLGFTFAYDATKENEDGFAPSRVVEREVDFYPRPIRKLRVCEPHSIKECKKLDTHTYLIDFGEEVVGLAKMCFTSQKEQTVTVSYGESLTDGHVRGKIHNRTFAFTYRAKVGYNDFTNYMLRLSCRYLEVTVEEDIDISYIGILPQIYIVPSRDDVSIDGDIEFDIYSISVRTLHLCMMEHYVDTPWREQCLYAFDARNQMLSGYRIFEGKNASYARSNLVLLSEDKRSDGLLSICSPCGTSLAIPSFSLYYIIAMYEYASEVHDTSLVREYGEKIEEILSVFLSRKNDEGLILSFGEKDKWNFYDWSEHLSGDLRTESEPVCDLVLNCLVILALDAYEKMQDQARLPALYQGKKEELRRAVHRHFKTENGAFTHIRGTERFTALGNALAILSGVATKEEARALADRLCAGEFVPSSLSMKVWIYDALIETDKDAYRDFILSDIRAHYEKMIPSGTVWETEDGAEAFDGAGSLCHGWSAIPIYIYHRLGVATYTPDGETPSTFEEAVERVGKKFDLMRDSSHCYTVLTGKTFDGYHGYSVNLYNYGDRIVITDCGDTKDVFDEVEDEEWEALCKEYGFTRSHYRIERQFRSHLDLYDYIEFMDRIADRFSATEEDYENED